MIKKRVVFWISADDIIEDYIVHNYALQDLSKKHEVYFVCSGNIESKICSLYNAKILNCDNNMSMKGKVLYKAIKEKENFDILIRVDADAIIMNVDWLIDLAYEHVYKRIAIVGNLGIKEETGQTYIRGGCNATSKEVVKLVDIEVNLSDTGTFDAPFNNEIRKNKVNLVGKDLFEQNGAFNGNCPVWHPPQIELSKRFLIFKKNQDLYLSKRNRTE